MTTVRVIGCGNPDAGDDAAGVAAVERARTRAGADRLLFVSHADVVRTILAHYLQLDLKTVRQLRIDHASLTALEINGTLADLLFLNYTTDPGSLS